MYIGGNLGFSRVHSSALLGGGGGGNWLFTELKHVLFSEIVLNRLVLFNALDIETPTPIYYS